VQFDDEGWGHGEGVLVTGSGGMASLPGLLMFLDFMRNYIH
jgi:hypothetical protein